MPQGQGASLEPEAVKCLLYYLLFIAALALISAVVLFLI